MDAHREGACFLVQPRSSEVGTLSFRSKRVTGTHRSRRFARDCTGCSTDRSAPDRSRYRRNPHVGSRRNWSRRRGCTDRRAGRYRTPACSCRTRRRMRRRGRTSFRTSRSSRDRRADGRTLRCSNSKLRRCRSRPRKMSRAETARRLVLGTGHGGRVLQTHKSEDSRQWVRPAGRLGRMSPDQKRRVPRRTRFHNSRSFAAKTDRADAETAIWK